MIINYIGNASSGLSTPSDASVEGSPWLWEGSTIHTAPNPRQIEGSGDATEGPDRCGDVNFQGCRV